MAIYKINHVDGKKKYYPKQSPDFETEEELKAWIVYKRMSLDEVTWDDVTESHSNESRIDAMIELGKLSESISEDVRRYIQGVNTARGASKANKNKMKTDLKEINEHLKDRDPMGAYELIMAMTPDGTLVTDEIKEDILAIFSRYVK